MRPVTRNILVAILALIPIAVSTYFYVRTGQDRDSPWNSSWVAGIEILIAFAGFFWANWPLYNHLSRGKRILATSGVAFCVYLLWGLLIATTVVVNLTTSLGGRL